MTANPTHSKSEAEIRALVEERVEAVRDKNAAAATSHHARDIRLFDVIPPLQYEGVAMARGRTQEWFGSFNGPIDYGIRDLDVASGDDVAFCHYLYRVGGTTTSGATIGMWVRATSCFRRIDGAWRVVHEHHSVPFDPATGHAALDLAP